MGECLLSIHKVLVLSGEPREEVTSDVHINDFSISDSLYVLWCSPKAVKSRNIPITHDIIVES